MKTSALDLSLGSLSSRTSEACLILLISLTLSACGLRPLTSHERTQVEGPVTDRAIELIEMKRLPDETPMRDIELTRALLRAHPQTARYLPHFITTSDLISQSVRRVGGGAVGDLIVFKPLERALSVAIIYEVLSPSQYRAIGILRGQLSQISIDLSSPDKRRRAGEVINTVIRPIHQGDEPPYLYLAGELFYELRRLF